MPPLPSSKTRPGWVKEKHKLPVIKGKLNVGGGRELWMKSFNAIEAR